MPRLLGFTVPPNVRVYNRVFVDTTLEQEILDLHLSENLVEPFKEERWPCLVTLNSGALVGAGCSLGGFGLIEYALTDYDVRKKLQQLSFEVNTEDMAVGAVFYEEEAGQFEPVCNEDHETTKSASRLLTPDEANGVGLTRMAKFFDIRLSVAGVSTYITSCKAVLNLRDPRNNPYADLTHASMIVTFKGVYMEAEDPEAEVDPEATFFSGDTLRLEYFNGNHWLPVFPGIKTCDPRLVAHKSMVRSTADISFTSTICFKAKFV